MQAINRACRFSKSPELFFKRIIILCKLSEYEMAHHHLDKLISSFPESYNCLVEFADEMYLSQQKPYALKSYTKFILIAVGSNGIPSNIINSFYLLLHPSMRPEGEYSFLEFEQIDFEY